MMRPDAIPANSALSSTTQNCSLSKQYLFAINNLVQRTEQHFCRNPSCGCTRRYIIIFYPLHVLLPEGREPELLPLIFRFTRTKRYYEVVCEITQRLDSRIESWRRRTILEMFVFVLDLACKLATNTRNPVQASSLVRQSLCDLDGLCPPLNNLGKRHCYIRALVRIGRIAVDEILVSYTFRTLP